MSEFSNQLKAKADLVRLIGEFVALKPGGNGALGLCPFHGEKSPSFHVHAAKQFYYCFGCHAHGDIFQFLMDLKKVAFPEAVALVAERLGIEVPRSAPGEADPQRQSLLRIHQVATQFFERCLAGRDGAVARAYLQNRELPPAATARFQLGYAPESGRGLVGFLETEGCAPELVWRSGLCQLRRESQLRRGGEASPATPAAAPSWSDLYDRFRGRLMFPIGDERGQVIAFGGRALESDPTGGAPKYLNSPESQLYTKGRVLYNLDRAKDAIRQLGYVILVEGYFDCIRVFAAGFENVVASCGTALTSAQIAPLARLTKKVVINFDPDAAGAAAAERSIGLLLEEDFQMRVVVLADGLDPDLFLRRHGREAYAAALKSSRSFFDYLAGRARRQFDLRRGEGKVAAINHLLPFLSHVRDPILRQTLAENLAAQLGVEQPLLSRELLRAVRERRPQLPAAKLASPELLGAERVILRAWIEWEPRRPELTALIQQERILDGLASAPLAEQLIATAGEGSDWAEVVEQVPSADRPLIAQLALAPQSEEPLTDQILSLAIEALRERRGAEAMRALQLEMREAAARGDKPRVEELARQKAAWDSRHRIAPGEPAPDSVLALPPAQTAEKRNFPPRTVI